MRPAFVLVSLPKILVLAAFANDCHSAADLVDLPWALWMLGTLLALALA